MPSASSVTWYLPGLIAARRLKRKEKNTGQLQVHRQLPCYDFCLEAGVGKVVTRWLNTVNIFPTSSTVFIHLCFHLISVDESVDEDVQSWKVTP